ncbi:class I adenylate-forming enzyme family protein [Halovivax sp.]|uniref:class I adenylate-forming enzyme family protein n=1 Tax=Halovivax sp. TaxID=1935978 RepID=UPI0025C31BE6|nr:class I adenylate-forming enzyme family protein [Halovivax sp.]
MTPDGWPTIDPLARRVRTTPERVALVDADGDATRTYRELSREVDAVAAGLDAIDADRLAVLLETGPAFVRTAFAAMRTGTTLVPLSTRETSRELRAKADRAGVDAVVCSRKTERAAAGIASELPGASSYSLEEPTVDGVDAFPSREPADAPAPARLEPTWTQLIGFTSGSSGTPKAVRLTARNLLASATASAFRLGVHRNDRWLVCLPMYHMGGFAPMIRSSLYGTGIVTQRKFEPSETARVVRERGVTGLSLVPTMVKRLLDAGWKPPEHLRFVLVGGAPASNELLDRALETDVPIYPTYGTTETASQVSTATPEQAERWRGTVGQPLFGTDVSVVDSEGDSVDPGETGELVVSGPTVSPGYLDEDRSLGTFDEDGFHTGDLGYRDEDGRLWITGRRSDRIVTGGENVDPEEVRRVLVERSDVSASAVVGIPDDEWGERVAAVVAADDPTALPEPTSIETYCEERLAGFKRPRTVRVVDELPRTVSGTVDRAAIRELLLDEEE